MRVHTLIFAVAIAASSYFVDQAAHACGGCFAPAPVGTEVPPVVTAHRMALSISTEQTVLWDQIRYSGAPSEFAWVLPIKPGARIEVASDAWFDVLDAATNPIVLPPELDCEDSSCSIGASAGMGCAADGDGSAGGIGVGENDGVDIVSHGSAGPYETVVLSSEDPEALTTWLEDHEYTIAEDIEPVIATYVEEGFDFIALRLAPGAGIQQMRPVRVIMQGAVPVLPLRMVAAGSGARTAISLFVIAEGRYMPSNFIEGFVDPKTLEYDFATGLTNYSTLRDAVYEQNAQQTFLVPYSKKGAFFRETVNPVSELPVEYRAFDASTGASAGYVKMADAYVQQAFINGETSSTACAAAFDGLEHDLRRVVDPCDEDGACREVNAAVEIDRRTLECDPPIGSNIPLDDLALALTGQHPGSVWVTRLDANLGRSAFGRDIELMAHPLQRERSGFITPLIATSSPCGESTLAAQISGRSRRDAARLSITATMLLILSGAVVRRLGRAARSKPVMGSAR